MVLYMRSACHIILIKPSREQSVKKGQKMKGLYSVGETAKLLEISVQTRRNDSKYCQRYFFIEKKRLLKNSA